MLKTTFDHTQIDLDVLKDRAFNHRWAEQEDGVLPLTAADPDFRVAQEITDSIQGYISEGYFSYGPAKGYESFRYAIANWYRDMHQVYTDKELIIGFNSAAEALDKVAKLLFNNGGNALIPDPVDFLFKTSIERNGGEARFFSFDLDSGRIQIDELLQGIDHNTKAIYLCNPNNPSGKSIHEDDVAQLVEIAEELNLLIISDEIWLDIYYERQIRSIAAFSELAKSRTVIISGLSKNFGLAGLRIGYCICPNKSFMKGLVKVSGHEETIGGLSTISQVATIAAFEKSAYWLEDFRTCLLYTSPSPRDKRQSRMPSSA